MVEKSINSGIMQDKIMLEKSIQSSYNIESAKEGIEKNFTIINNLLPFCYLPSSFWQDLISFEKQLKT